MNSPTAVSADPRHAARDPASTATVPVRDKATRERWARELGVTTEALESAVLVVGSRVDRIKDYLTAGMARHQQDG